MTRAVLLLLALLTLTLAAHSKDKPAPAKGGLLKYAMALNDAEAELADTESWQVAYRIDTPSTSEIACLWQDSVFYLAKFYEGRCYWLEKRAQVPKAEVEALINLYTETYGPTPEASQDRDKKLMFARWNRSEREVSIYAIRGEGDTYKLIYEEIDPVLRGEARRAQEQELAARPVEEDPVSGKRIRVNPLGAAGLGPDDPNESEEGEEGEESPESEPAAEDE